MLTTWKNGKYQPLVKYVTLKDLKKLSNAIDIINGDSDTKGSIKKAIKDLVGEAPEAYDTLKEIADKLKSDDDLHKALNDAIILKASSDALNTEINRATSAETANKNAIDGEVTRAKSAEKSLQDQITSNDSDITNLTAKHESLSRKVQGIAATGGASTATNVTYNNDASRLNAENAQDAIDELASKKFDKTSIAQELGTALDKVMSQKAVTDNFTKEANRVNTELGKKADKETVNTELDKKIDKASIEQTIGNSETAVMSQKAVSFKFDELSTQVNSLEKSALKLKNIPVTTGYYIHKRSGNTNQYGGGAITNYQSMSGVTEITYTGIYGYDACIVAFYSADKKFISSVGDSIELVAETGYKISSFPSNAAYFRVSFLNYDSTKHSFRTN